MHSLCRWEIHILNQTMHSYSPGFPYHSDNLSNLQMNSFIHSIITQIEFWELEKRASLKLLFQERYWFQKISFFVSLTFDSFITFTLKMSKEIPTNLTPFYSKNKRVISNDDKGKWLFWEGRYQSLSKTILTITLKSVQDTWKVLIASWFGL